MDLLVDSPTLLLFVVAALGFLLARVRVHGFSLGIAGVLFAGIAVGALDPRLKLPEPIWVLGLALFVYTVGLSSGPGFVGALRRRGLAANGLAVAALAAGTGLTVAAWALTSLSAPAATGTFAGALTNTPALAAAIEALEGVTSSAEFDRLAAEPIVGFSLAYPFGVVVPLLAVFWLLRRAGRGSVPRLVTRTARVERGGRTLGAVAAVHGGGVTFGRVKRDETRFLVATADLELAVGDLVTVVGVLEEVDAVVAELGHLSTHHLSLDRDEFDFRRIVVSDSALAGRRIADLDLPARFAATVTRVRRGDIDLLAEPDTVVELGDRVRVVAPRARLDEVSRFFGDSYRALGEVDILSLALGIALGLLLGSVPFPLPGGTFELGFAGGPLVVGLAAGALGRTGPLVWQVPYTANLTLRQLGTVLFLAGIGTRSGDAFAHTITDPQALVIVGAGLLITCIVVGTALVGGLLVLRLPPRVLAGAIAGMQTQPAVLAFATEQVADDREVALGYATVYPVAMIVKILVAQLLLNALY